MSRPKLSSADATFAVFDRAAAAPFPFWAVLVFYVLAGFLLFAPAGALALWDLAQGDWPGRSADTDPLQALANLIGLLMWPVAAMAEAALLRWMLRGSPEGPLLGVRFGLDELKIMLIHVMFAVIIIAAIVGTLLAVAIAAGLAAAFGSGGAAFLLSVLFITAGVCGALYVLARFSPAAALTIERGGFRFFEAWTVTQGNTGSLLGAHILRIFLSAFAQAAVAVMLAVLVLSLLSPVAGPLLNAAFAGDAPREAPPLAWAAGGVLFLLGFALFTALEFARVAMSAGIGASLVRTVEGAPAAPAPV